MGNYSSRRALREHYAKLEDNSNDDEDDDDGSDNRNPSLVRSMSLRMLDRRGGGGRSRQNSPPRHLANLLAVDKGNKTKPA